MRPVSVDKDKSEPKGLGSKPAGKTVVGVPAIPPDVPSDVALTREIPPQAAGDDDAPTVHNASAMTPADAERVLSDRPPTVAGALPPRPPAAGIKTPPLAGEMFRGLPRPPTRPIETETKTRAGVAPQSAVASKGRSTLLLDGSAPPAPPLDPNGESPPIVVPVSGAQQPKAVTQPPPWGEGAAHASVDLPRNVPPMRPREPSAEEISSSMLLPPDAVGGFPVPAAEELSGSVLLDDVAPPGPVITHKPAPSSIPPPLPPAARSAPPPPVTPAPKTPSVKPPTVSHKPPAPSVKPPVPTSTRPVPPAHRTMLGMPELPKTTPAPDLSKFPGSGSVPPPLPGSGTPPPLSVQGASGAPPPAPLPETEQPAVMLAQSLVVEMNPPPSPAAFPPAPMPDTFAAPATGIGGAGDTAPLPPAGQGPVTGDIEVTRLPPSPMDRVHEVLERGREHGLAILERVRVALGRVREQMAPLAQRLVAKLPEPAAQRLGRRPELLLVVVGVGGLVVGIGLVGLLVSLFRGPASNDQDSPTAKASSAASLGAPSLSAAVAPLAAPSSAPALTHGLGPCTVVGAAHVLAPSAIVNAGVEVVAGGNEVAVGFAPDDKSAMAVRLDPAEVTVGNTARAKSRDPVRRVTPLLTKGVLSLAVDTDRKGDKLEGRRTVRATPPVQLGANADGQLGWAKLGGAPAGALWPLQPGSSVDALRGAVDGSGDPTIAVAFRTGGNLFTGTIGGTGGLGTVGPLSRIDGLGTTIGSPAVAIASSVVFVAWADRPSNDAAWRLRWTHFAAGSAPEKPTDFAVPDGGKGEPFMSPALATVPGGRMLLLWTEGPASGHVVRGQTLALDGTRIGPPLDISADGTNAGQAQAAVTESGTGVVAFLESGAKGFQVAATAITCGTP